MTELIIFDESQKLSYFQKCKIVINKIEKHLSLFPNNDETDFISINFGEKCYQKNNFLCLFSGDDQKKKYVLNFFNSGTCEKVFNLIKSKKDNVTRLIEPFLNQVFVPILDEIQSNTFTNPRLTEIIKDFVNSFEEEKEKQIFLDSIKKAALETLYSSLKLSNVISTEDPSNNPNYSTSHFPATNSTESLQTSCNLKGCEVLKLDYHLKENKDGFVSERKLSLRKRALMNISYCENYENDDIKNFENLEDKIADENGFSGSDKKDPAFKRRKYSNKYSNSFEKVLPLNIYEIIIYEIFGQLKTRLIIFTSMERKYCYQYFWDNTKNYFICCGCSSAKEKKFVAAIKSRDQSGNECIKLNGAEHVCHPIEYNPDKFKSDIKLYSPDYELFKCTRYGVETKYLIIFISNEKNYCYEFRYNEKKKKFYCLKCQNKKYEILAAICKDKNQKEYVNIRNVEHVCGPIPYISSKYIDQEIIYLPNFQLYEKWFNGKKVQRMAIYKFDEEENKKEFYEYTKISETLYRCFKCNVKRNHFVSAKLIKNDKNDIVNSVQLSEVQHICEPQISEVAIEETLPIFIKLPNFKVEIIRKHFCVLRKQLIVFIQDDQNLCYIYASHGGKTYVCNECNKLKKYVAAKIRVDENGEDFVELLNTEHACKPQKYVAPNENDNDVVDDESNISMLDMQQPQTKNDLITFETLSKLLKPERLLKEPNFKIDSFTNFDSTISKQLTVFDFRNSNFSYNYHYIACKELYICNGCKENGKYVSAKFHPTENIKESFLELGEIEHVCEPQPNEKILKSNEIEIQKAADGKITKLIIFDDMDSKDLCYEFTPIRHNRFRCNGCFIKNKNFFYQAKTFENENKEYYIKLGNYQHVCNPISYESIKK